MSVGDMLLIGRFEQVILVDDVDQVVAGHDLLAEDFDPLLGISRDGGFDEIRGDLLRFDQDGRLGLIQRRKRDRDDDGDQEYHDRDRRP